MRRLWCVCWGNNTGGLYGAERDAEQWASFWRKQSQTHVVLLQGALTLKQLTQTVKQIHEQATAEDVFFFSYSGHGYQRARLPGQGPEETDGQDEVWYLADGTCLRDHDLLTLLYCPTKPLYYWLSLDCCHVGLVEDLQRMPHLQPEQRWCVLSACMEHQYSQEALSQTGYIMGAFTAIVLEVLELKVEAPRSVSGLLIHPLFQERRAFLKAFGQTLQITCGSNTNPFAW